MSILIDERLNLFLMQEKLWMLTRPTGLVVYDYRFEDFFQCAHKWRLPETHVAVARIGPLHDYDSLHAGLAQEGVQLIHTPDQHRLCSELPHWYPLIADLTPRSRWFGEMPDLETITEAFDWPIFVKGARQTSKHQKSLSIIDGPDAFLRLRQQYSQDPILHWQDVVCREYTALRPVEAEDDDGIPPAFEFRTFWWKGQFVGAGRYWYENDQPEWTPQEQKDALAIAQAAAQRVAVPFLVVDVAQRTDGQWIVIECNDGMESGYADVFPFTLWKNILAVEKRSILS